MLPTINMSATNPAQTLWQRFSGLCKGLAAFVLAAVSPALLAADSMLNMPVGVTEISRQTYDLHMIIFLICVAIGVVVYGVLIYSLIMHRKSKGVVPATFHHSTTVEIVWTDEAPAFQFVGPTFVRSPERPTLTRFVQSTRSARSRWLRPTTRVVFVWSAVNSA